MLVILWDMIKERYSHDEDWSWAMLVILWDMNIEHLSCLMHHSK